MNTHERMHMCAILTQMELDFMLDQPGLSTGHSGIQCLDT